MEDDSTLGARLSKLRHSAGLTQEELADKAGVSRDLVAKLEQRKRKNARPGSLRLLAAALCVEPSALLGQQPVVAQPAHETVRQELDNALSAGAMADASLEDWEQTVVRYGQATRDRAPDVLLEDLSCDLGELQRALNRYRSASALRRLTWVAASMSGLMCLTLVKLDDRPGFRRWARTARRAADEAGDPATCSWVLAQEAHGHYYSADFPLAIDIARHAQDLVRDTPCVGSTLAAALEGRAQAAMGRRQEARAALKRAETVLSRLDGDSLATSALGYNEAQLRFHEGNAYTWLHDAVAAFAAQDRALELCAPGDYTDWAMIRLDRAICLADASDYSGSLECAGQTQLGRDNLMRDRAPGTARGFPCLMLRDRRVELGFLDLLGRGAAFQRLQLPQLVQRHHGGGFPA